MTCDLIIWIWLKKDWPPKMMIGILNFLKITESTQRGTLILGLAISELIHSLFDAN